MDEMQPDWMTPQSRSAITPSAWWPYRATRRDWTACSALADEIGTIDVHLIDAGVGKITHLDDMTEQVYDEVFAINTKGAYFTMKGASIPE